MDPETTPPRLAGEPDHGPGSAVANDAHGEPPTTTTTTSPSLPTGAAPAAAIAATKSAHGASIAAVEPSSRPNLTISPLPSADPTIDPGVPASGAAADDDDEDDAPLFWTTTSPTRLHQRTVSAASYQSISHLRPAAISLEDRSSEDAHETARACWAYSVSVDEYVVVSGATGIGAYVVWHCTVRTLQGGDLYIRKRYSEFDQLRTHLVRAFPHAEAMIPQLPRKSVVSRFRPKFLEQRRAGLSHFLNCILLNPEFAASPILKDFIFT